MGERTMVRRFVMVLASAAGLTALLAAAPSGAVPACKSGEERVGDKCRAACPADTKRSTQPPYACESTLPRMTCKAGEELIGGKCRVLCPPGRTRNLAGACSPP